MKNHNTRTLVLEGTLYERLRLLGKTLKGASLSALPFSDLLTIAESADKVCYSDCSLIAFKSDLVIKTLKTEPKVQSQPVSKTA